MGKLSLSTDTSNTPLLLVIRKAYLDVQMVKKYGEGKNRTRTNVFHGLYRIIGALLMFSYCQCPFSEHLRHFNTEMGGGGVGGVRSISPTACHIPGEIGREPLTVISQNKRRFSVQKERPRRPLPGGGLDVFFSSFPFFLVRFLLHPAFRKSSTHVTRKRAGPVFLHTCPLPPHKTPPPYLETCTLFDY